MAKNQITPFGEKVKEALKAKDMTQGDLAEKLGVTTQYLYLVLFGKKPGKRLLPMIAEICEISMESDTEDTVQTGEPFEESNEPGDETERDIKEIPKKEKRQVEQHLLTPFGVMVVDTLDDMDMKQVELARQIGTSKQYLYMILHGQRSGRKYLKMISKICEIDRESDSGDMDRAEETCGESKKPVKETRGDIREIFEKGER